MTDNNSGFMAAFARYVAAHDAALREKRSYARWCKLEGKADDAFEDVMAAWRTEHTDIGRQVSRSEALCISQETLDRAERERLDEGQPDVEALRDAVIEEARLLCEQVEAHSARAVGGDGLPSGEKQIINLQPLCHAVTRLRKADRE